MEKNKRLTPIKAARAKCLDCMCGNRAEVRLCPSKDCALWIYRFGCTPESNRAKRYFAENVD